MVERAALPERAGRPLSIARLPSVGIEDELRSINGTLGCGRARRWCVGGDLRLTQRGGLAMHRLLLLLGVKEISALVAATALAERPRAPLIAWATSHGARVIEAIEIKSGQFGQGLFAADDIAAGTEMVMLPGVLQLGVYQLAQGRNFNLQSLCQAMPDKDAGSAPCSISLCAELALGPASIFIPYLAELPTLLSGAIAPSPSGYGSSSTSDYDDAADLESWPATESKVSAKRRVIRELHTASAPSSLSLSDLCWASAIVESRAFRTRNVPTLSAAEEEKIGSRAATDLTRLLPVIDLANHAGALSNAAVGNIRRKAHRMEASAPPTATSLVSTREIKSGEEITLDYGAGSPINNERLLLEYGFVLRPHADDWVDLPFEALVYSAALAMPDAQAERAARGIEVRCLQISPRLAWPTSALSPSLTHTYAGDVCR